MIDFVAIDFETANNHKNSACALGFAVVRNGEIVETGQHLIRPPAGEEFAPFNTKLHGIDHSQVKAQPTLAELLPTLGFLVDNCYLVAHNAPFDISVLRHSLAHFDAACPQADYLCSLNVARLVWPELPDHKLPTVAKHLQIPLDHHSADSDAMACARILLAACQAKEAKNIPDLAKKLGVSIRKLEALPASNLAQPAYRKPTGSQPDKMRSCVYPFAVLCLLAITGLVASIYQNLFWISLAAGNLVWFVYVAWQSGFFQTTPESSKSEDSESVSWVD